MVLKSAPLGRTGLADTDVTPELFVELLDALKRRKDVPFNERQLQVAFSRYLQHNKGDWTHSEAKDLNGLEKLAAKLVKADAGVQKGKLSGKPGAPGQPRPKPMSMEEMILGGALLGAGVAQLLSGDPSGLMQTVLPMDDPANGKNTKATQRDVRAALQIDSDKVLTAIDEDADTTLKRKNGIALLDQTMQHDGGVSAKNNGRLLSLMAHERDPALQKRFEELHPGMTRDALFQDNLPDVVEKELLKPPSYMSRDYKDEFKNKHKSAARVPWYLPTDLDMRNGPKPPTWVNTEADENALIDDVLRDQQRRQS